MITSIPSDLEDRLRELADRTVTARETERRTQSLERVELTIDEKLEYGKLNADSQRAIKQLEDDLATVKKQMQAQIETQKAVIDQRSEALRSGYEPRMVECVDVLEFPKPGRKTTFRLDTIEAVNEGLMTENEMQRMLKLEDDLKEREAKAAEAEPETPASEPAAKLPKARKPDATA